MTARQLDRRTASDMARAEQSAFAQEADYIVRRLLSLALMLELFAHGAGGDRRTLNIAGELRAMRHGIARKWLGRVA